LLAVSVALDALGDVDRGPAHGTTSKLAWAAG
jgi:hypothetical protein